MDDRLVEAVAFDAENVSATQYLEDHTEEVTCQCGDYPEFQGAPQEDCEDCHGTGRYLRTIKGWKHSKVLAPNAKAFIDRRLSRVFYS